MIDEVADGLVDSRQIAPIQLPGGELRRQLLEQRDPLSGVTLMTCPGGRTGRLDSLGSEGSSRPGEFSSDDLAGYFGTTDRFWLNLQTSFDQETEKDHLGRALDQVQPLRTA